MILINSKSNPLLANGEKAFDLRAETNKMCQWGQKREMTIEPPIRLGGGHFSCGFIGAFTFFNGNSCIREVDSIGRFCMIGPDVTIGDPQHYVTDVSGHIIFTHSDCRHFLKFTNCENHYFQESFREKHKTKKPKITIGNDVWIGRNVMVMRGITIGDGAVIGAGALVTKDVLPYSVVGGVPAKFIKYRFTADIIEELEKIKWWEYGPEIMNGIDIENPQKAVEQLKKNKENMESYKPQMVILNPKDNTIRVC